MTFQRHQRIAAQARKCLPQIICECTHHHPVLSQHSVTVWQVESTPDMRTLHVSLGVLGVSHRENHTCHQDHFHQLTPFIRQKLTQKLQLRRAPQLRIQWVDAFLTCNI